MMATLPAGTARDFRVSVCCSCYMFFCAERKPAAHDQVCVRASVRACVRTRVPHPHVCAYFFAHSPPDEKQNRERTPTPSIPWAHRRRRWKRTGQPAQTCGVPSSFSGLPRCRRRLGRNTCWRFEGGVGGGGWWGFWSWGARRALTSGEWGPSSPSFFRHATRPIRPPPCTSVHAWHVTSHHLHFGM